MEPKIRPAELEDVPFIAWVELQANKWFGNSPIRDKVAVVHQLRALSSRKLIRDARSNRD